MSGVVQRLGSSIGSSRMGVAAPDVGASAHPGPDRHQRTDVAVSPLELATFLVRGDGDHLLFCLGHRTRGRGHGNRTGSALHAARSVEAAD